MSKLIESLLKETGKTVEEIKNDIYKNQEIQSLKLPQIEPNPFDVKVKPPTAMEIYNRLDKKEFEIEILPQTELYLENLKRIFNIENNNIEEVIDKSIVFLYELIKNELK